MAIPLIAASALALLYVAPTAANSLSQALWQESELKLQLRSHALFRDRVQGTDSEAWAAGGALSYRSGWVANRLQLGGKLYTSQPLYAPADKDGTALLATGQQGYTVLGEGYARWRFDQHQLSAGRMVLNQFELNPQDTRMTPRSFEGVSLAGQLGGVTYFAGWIERMKSRHWDYFLPVAEVAGAPSSEHQPLLAMSLRASPLPTLSLGLGHYQLNHLLASTYAEANWSMRLSSQDRLQLSGQLMRQQSIGDNRLTGEDFATQSAGVRLAWTRGSITFAALAMQTDEGAAYRTPFGTWLGYACRMITSFNRAGERVAGMDVIWRFDEWGAKGLTLYASATQGSEARNALTGQPLPDQQEYDLTLDYRFNDAQLWPSWMQSMSLRARIGRLEQQGSSPNNSQTEQHLILNYEVPLK